MPSDHFSNKSDESYKQHFSQEAQKGTRDPFQGTPEERQQQARKKEEAELERQALVEDVPVPTGAGENIHAEDAALPKDGEVSPDKEPKPEG